VSEGVLQPSAWLSQKRQRITKLALFSSNGSKMA
jgi:hypothetical protein